MRELETSLRQFAEFILKAQLVKEKAAPSGHIEKARPISAITSSDIPPVGSKTMISPLITSMRWLRR